MKARLILKNLLHGKRRTMLSILCILCSVMLLYVVSNAYVSFQRMRTLDAYERYGKYHYILHDIDQDTFDSVRERLEDKVTLGTEKIMNPGKRELALLFCDINALEMNHYEAEFGSLPKSADEIAVSATAKIDNQFVIGTYTVGDRIELEGTVYRLTGILNDYDYSTSGTYHVALTGDTEVDEDHYNVYIYVDNNEDLDYTEEVLCDILHISGRDFSESEKKEGFLNDERAIRNTRLIDYEYDSTGTLDDTNIQALLLGVFVTLLLTAVVLVTLVYHSYFRDRKKQVGVLKSLGLPTRFILFVYSTEAIIILIFGCVTGILAGNGLTRLLFEWIQQRRNEPLKNFHVVTEWKFTLFILALCVVAMGIGVVIALLNMVRVEIVTLQKGTERNGNVRQYRDYGGRRITRRFFRRDKTLPERSCLFFSLMLIATTVLMLLYTNRYMNDQLKQREVYDVEYDLLSGQNDRIWDLPNILSQDQITYYDVVFDTSAACSFPHTLYDWENDDYYVLDEDGYVYCEIVGASRAHFEHKIDASITYDELVASGGALIVDNIGKTDTHVLAEIPKEVVYKGRNDEGGPCFLDGTLSLIGRATFKNWSDQRGISIIVPDEVFKNRFDYTNLLIRINAIDGQELSLAETLNKLAPIYNYSFQDHTTEYLKQEDNQRTIRLTVYGAALFIGLMNAGILIYMHLLIFIRRSKQLLILRIIGHSDHSLMAFLALTELPGCFAGSVISLFLAVLFIRNNLPPITRDVLLDGEVRMFLISFGAVILLQCMALVVVGWKMRSYREMEILRYSD